jgi:hypothetical protein
MRSQVKRAKGRRMRGNLTSALMWAEPTSAMTCAPKMSEGRRAVCEETADFLRAAQDQEYMLRTARDDAEARCERLVAAWGVLPLAPAWEQRPV